MLVPRPGEMILVDLSRRGSRLGKVAYAKSLFDSELLFASIDIDKLSGNDPDIAIGLWRPFVWNWARIGRHLGDEGAALTAEIALGIVARRYYLTATVDGFNIAMATADPIACRLAGRAVLQLRSGRRDNLMRGPWEAPIVQRAGELGLGVRTPDQIELSAAWSGADDRSDGSRRSSNALPISSRLLFPAGQSRPQRSGNDAMNTQTRPDFSKRLSALPTEPGVYLMKNADGKVIYVGKAIALRNRVRSYFQSTRGQTPKTRELVANITDWELSH
ncbi:MAG: GIY-YIG nuclease family protein [Thermomicrobiales bacterium]